METAPWDAFLNNRPGAHFQQTSLWAEVKRIYGWKPLWIWATRAGRMLGGAVLLTMRVSGFAHIGYVSRGPIWDADEPGAMEASANALFDVARLHRLAYLVIVPPYEGGELVAYLRSRHFRVKPDHFPPSVATDTATLTINLTRGPDALLADMSMSKRQNVRRALRKDVRVRLGGAADAAVFRDLMWQSCQRRGIRPSPPQSDFFDTLWRVMGPSGKLRLFIAEVDGQPISGACTFVSGGTMYLWRVGWSGTFEKHGTNDLLHLEAMRWAQEHGCRTFDFMHIVPDHARAILDGTRADGSYSGVTDFKTGFGGQVRLLPSPFYRSFHPAVYPALRMGGARVIEAWSKRVKLRIS